VFQISDENFFGEDLEVVVENKEEVVVENKEDVVEVNRYMEGDKLCALKKSDRRAPHD
jgi:hypothetical protein